MSAFVKFNQTVGDLGVKKIDLNGDTLAIVLTNTAPNVADIVYNGSTFVIGNTSNAADLATSGGYTQGGTTIGTHAYSQTSGTGTLSLSANLVFTATTGFGPFRYATLIDLTSGATATRSLLGYWDYGSSITLAALETFTWAPTGLAIATFA